MISINWDRESLCRQKERQRERERECVCVEGLRDRKSVCVYIEKLGGVVPSRSLPAQR